MPQLFVAAGRTVIAGDDIAYAQGELVSIPDKEEAARLVSLGFLQDNPPTILPPPAPNPSAIGLQSGHAAQGPRYS